MLRILAVLLATLCLPACDAPSSRVEQENTSPLDEAADRARLGQPRRELSAADLAAFERGKRIFVQRLPTLGPLYNDESCAACHFIPAVGGSGDLEHAEYMGPRNAAGPPRPDGRPRGDTALYHRRALPGWAVPTRPPNVSRRIPPPLYGVGLIERIPDATIRAHCGEGHIDSAKLQGAEPRNQVARFGHKPYLGTVMDFVASELFTQGISNALEGPGSKDDDSFPDPEVDSKFVADLAAFVRGLQPPGRNGTDAGGEAAFRSFGCSVCHVPDMPPATNVFSDFCVHRMGEALADGIFDHEAEGDEFGTTPLQGLRFKTVLLHDGRATTVDAAIRAHGGESQRAADAYRDAPGYQREALLRFLKTL